MLFKLDFLTNKRETIAIGWLMDGNKEETYHMIDPTKYFVFEDINHKFNLIGNNSLLLRKDDTFEAQIEYQTQMLTELKTLNKNKNMNIEDNNTQKHHLISTYEIIPTAHDMKNISDRGKDENNDRNKWIIDCMLDEMRHEIETRAMNGEYNYVFNIRASLKGIAIKSLNIKNNINKKYYENFVINTINKILFRQGYDITENGEMYQITWGK